MDNVQQTVTFDSDLVVHEIVRHAHDLDYGRLRWVDDEQAKYRDAVRGILGWCNHHLDTWM